MKTSRDETRKREIAEAVLKFVPFVAIWLAFIAIKFVVIIAGLPIVAWMYRYRDIKYDELPSWMRPWANPEDWYGGPQGVPRISLPEWWILREGSGFKSWWHYHAIRNPANGLRSFEFLDLDIDKERVRFVANEYRKHYEPWDMRKPGSDMQRKSRFVWYLAWQGWQAGCKIVYLWNAERHFVLKMGWRVGPADAFDEIDPDGIRHEDAGFATKLLPYRRG